MIDRAVDIPRQHRKRTQRSTTVSSAQEHILTYKQLLGVLAILVLLTIITVLASKIDLGALNIWLALLIASTKASFVLLFFMHLKYEGKVFMITFLVTVFTVAILIGFLFWDIAFRYS